MTTPQIIMIALLALTAWVNIINNGDHYTKNALGTLLVSAPLMTTILWAGGYWEVINAPQIITIILMTLNCCTAMTNHGKQVQYTGYLTVVLDIPLVVGIYYWGGFWG